MPVEGVMSDHIQEAVKTVIGRFGAESREFRQQITLVLAADKLLDAMTLLRDTYHFNILMDVTAVDYLDKDPRFHLVYQLYSFDHRDRICLRVPVSNQAPHLPSVEKVFPGANWYEREVFDLFGISFDNHSDLRRIIMPADWQGHPLRKDYPLGYEEVQFTFNFDEISLRKPRGKEFRPGDEVGHD
jgi:NADH-quinone oxidoreductase subunit C